MAFILQTTYMHFHNLKIELLDFFLNCKNYHQMSRGQAPCNRSKRILIRLSLMCSIIRNNAIKDSNISFSNKLCKLYYHFKTIIKYSIIRNTKEIQQLHAMSLLWWIRFKLTYKHIKTVGFMELHNSFTMFIQQQRSQNHCTVIQRESLPSCLLVRHWSNRWKQKNVVPQF